MSKFTKGTWRLEDKNRQVCCKIFPIANISYEFLPLSEAEANARLIMYAPKMYEILNRVLKEVDNADIQSDIISLLKNIDNENI